MTSSSMATELPLVRRLEAISFRSWPATTTTFDGAWAIRLTAGHPSKRINSVNPLDRGDQSDLQNRIVRVARRFQNFGRPLVFRQSPLAPPRLDRLFDAGGWRRFDETRVMVLDLQSAKLAGAVDQLALKDVGRWIDQCIAMGSVSVADKPGLSELIDLVEGEVGLFLTEDGHGIPLAAAMAVQYGDFVGLFEVVSNPEMRQLGLGRRMVRTALLWGLKNGARHAWLQVVSNNHAANKLYESEGFSEVYRYAYRQAPDGFQG